MNMFRKSRRILVVEDNGDALRTVCAMLEALGYEPQATGTAEEALAMLAREQFEVMLIDIGLPGMSGIELANRVAETYPATKIIFGSGAGYLVAEETRFEFSLLQKPYFLPQLRALLTDETPHAYSAAHMTARTATPLNAR